MVKSNAGSLSINVVEASGLKGKKINGLSDPYVVVEADGKEIHRSTPVRDTIQPKWELVCTLDNIVVPPSILITVWSSGKRLKAKFLGQVSLPTKVAMEGKPIDQWFILDKRSSKSHVSGSVHVKLTWKGPLKDNSESIGAATLTVMEAKDLSDCTDMESTFATIHSGDSEFRTDFLYGKNNPKWKSTFTVPIKKGSGISIRVWRHDGNRQRFLGEVYLDERAILDSSRRKHKDWHSLTSNREFAKEKIDNLGSKIDAQNSLAPSQIRGQLLLAFEFDSAQELESSHQVWPGDISVHVVGVRGLCPKKPTSKDPILACRVEYDGIDERTDKIRSWKPVFNKNFIFRAKELHSKMNFSLSRFIAEDGRVGTIIAKNNISFKLLSDKKEHQIWLPLYKYSRLDGTTKKLAQLGKSISSSTTGSDDDEETESQNIEKKEKKVLVGELFVRLQYIPDGSLEEMPYSFFDLKEIERQLEIYIETTPIDFGFSTDKGGGDKTNHKKKKKGPILKNFMQKTKKKKDSDDGDDGDDDDGDDDDDNASNSRESNTRDSESNTFEGSTNEEHSSGEEYSDTASENLSQKSSTQDVEKKYPPLPEPPKQTINDEQPSEQTTSSDQTGTSEQKTNEDKKESEQLPSEQETVEQEPVEQEPVEQLQEQTKPKSFLSEEPDPPDLFCLESITTTDQLSPIEYKLIMVGDSGVGKTNLCVRYDLNKFEPNPVSTVGVDMSSKKYLTPSGLITCKLWDTAGQERFQTVTKIYYRGVHGALLVYDVTNRDTFERLDFWLKEMKVFCFNEHVVLMLVGNKNDLRNENDPSSVSLKEGHLYAEKNSMLFFETSAKDDENIHQAFQLLLQYVHRISYQSQLESKNKEQTLEKEKLSPSENSGCPC